MFSGLSKLLSVLLVGGMLFLASSFLWAGGSVGKVDGMVRPAGGGISAPDKVVSASERPAKEQEMVASYYGQDFAGEPTATGEPFDPDGYTAAHKSLPLGTELKVSYGGESVKVTVNDRGPYVAGRDIDLSLAAAQKIGLVQPGSAQVRVIKL